MTSHLGKDLRIMPFFSAHDTSALDLLGTDRLPPQSRRRTVGADLAIFAGRQNLAQALTLRLLTPKGSLVALGHAQYGSRLHELIGQLKNDTNRNLCRLFVLETVAQEPRVQDKAVAFSFDLARETISSFYFDLTVQPINGDAPVSLGLEVAL